MTATLSSPEECVVLAHGGGGQLTSRLLAERVLPVLANPLLNPLGDSAVLEPVRGRLVFTTDAFVVQPLEFPGGDIGRLAVCGTVNDLAVMGAIPRALSLALIIEEGLPLATLDRVVASIATAAREAGVPIATGDTKVIERRGGDGLMITTAGVGELAYGVDWSINRIAPGDRILITGGLAEHGLTIMTQREGMGIESDLRSDAAPLIDLVTALRRTGAAIRFMRDPTRGGVAGVLNDIAEGTRLSVHVQEAALPLTPVVRHTAELLGLDPLTVANEGKCVVVVAASDAQRVLQACQAHPLGRSAALIGEVVDASPPLVELQTAVGGARIVQRPYGEELPRIC
ncbi:MAG TPA: hydrogenase expression/formation protein HypE [Phycisphaerae bacterium]|nr:hydrogenase expression/formation protein HypE [Phycisphaerae bacterium]